MTCYTRMRHTPSFLTCFIFKFYVCLVYKSMFILFILQSLSLDRHAQNTYIRIIVDPGSEINIDKHYTCQTSNQYSSHAQDYMYELSTAIVRPQYEVPNKHLLCILQIKMKSCKIKDSEYFITLKGYNMSFSYYKFPFSSQLVPRS